jgi:hypothetical protein
MRQSLPWPASCRGGGDRGGSYVHFRCENPMVFAAAPAHPGKVEAFRETKNVNYLDQFVNSFHFFESITLTWD